MPINSKVVSYINGVRFYPQAVSYTAQRGGYGNFTVSLPAVKQWQTLPRRSHCAVFFEDPVTKTWRLLCEGDYTGYSMSKTGDGSRSRSLHFQCLHAVWQQTRYCSLVAAQDNNLAQIAAISDAQGQLVEETTSGTSTKLRSFIEILDEVSRKVEAVSALLPLLVETLVQQSPVDVFYLYARKLVEKMVAMPDKEIGRVIDVFRFRDLSQNSLAAFGISPNTTLHQLLSAWEGMAFYQHAPIPAPPMTKSEDPEDPKAVGKTIHQLLFSPALHYTVPPICNVIFRDQIQLESGSRDFRLEPTRVISNNQLGINSDGGTGVPNLFMVNHNGPDEFPIAEPSKDSTASPGLKVTHLNLSKLELEQGVVPKLLSFEIEKITANPEKADSPKFYEYMFYATRHHFELERGQPVRRSLGCTFQPYLVPGMYGLFEIPDDPIFGVVESVTHALSATGETSTSVEITHCREAFVLSGKNRTPYYPIWFNDHYRADKIAETYRKILGRNAKTGDLQRTAMVPNSQITGGSKGQTARPNLDELARQVVNVPTYSSDGTREESSNVESLSDRIRGMSPSPEKDFLEVQYRPGTLLSEYVEFHGLKPTGNPNINPDLAANAPYADLNNSTEASAAELFGTPYGLRYTESRTKAPVKPWGIYTPVNGTGGPISDERRQITLMIQRAVERPLSRD
jgi:hypothetical protein